MSSFFSRLTNGQTPVIAVLSLSGVLIGVGLMRALISSGRDGDTLRYHAVQHQDLEGIASRHLRWADDAANAGIHSQSEAVHAFFERARSGTQGFAEASLGWRSKWLLVKDTAQGSDELSQHIELLFSTHVFRADELEQLLEGCIAAYMQHLGYVDSELLVRLEADLEDIPATTTVFHANREQIQFLVSDAIQDSLESLRADFRGATAREIVSILSGEVLTLATTRLATSAGIIGAGAGTGTVTLGAGIIVGLIVDWIASWIYDAIYDPAGEISRRLDSTLTELELTILQGDGSAAGLEERLREFAAHRAAARNGSIRSVLLP